MNSKKIGLWAALILATTSLGVSCGGGSENITNSSEVNKPEEVKTSFTSIAGTVNKTNSKALAQTTSNTSKVSIKLIVDSNKDGIFDENSGSDKVYTAITTVQNGNFIFPNVEIPETGTKANLIISADGYTSYSKILTLKPKTPINLSIQLLPVSTKIIPINRNRASQKIFLTLNKNGNIDVFYGNRSIDVKDSQLTVSLNENEIPKSVTALKVSMRTFNSAHSSDLKYFPGEFKGTDPKASDKEVGLESVTFAFVSLKDQNGNPLTISGQKDSDGCLYSITQTLPKEAISKIKEKGDFDPNEPGCQVPIYSYNYNSEDWDYLGTGTIEGVNNCNDLNENNNYKVDICITKPNWGEYVNLDYPIYFEQVKNVKLCFLLKGNDSPISGAWFDLYKDGFYMDSYTDDDGKASFELPINKNTESCQDVIRYLNSEGVSIDYYLPSITPTPISVDLANTTTINNITGCNCTFEIETAIQLYDITVKAPPNREVCLRTDDFTYYDCKFTDRSGIATFKVPAGKEYVAFGSGLSQSTFNPETTQTVTLVEKNNPPEMNLLVYPLNAKKGEPVTVQISAYDIDGDELNIRKLNCGGGEGELLSTVSYPGYLSATAKCIFNVEGESEISATVSDGKAETTKKETVYVLQNIPPAIYSYNFIDQDGNIVPSDQLRLETPYKIEVFAYDPDGDPLSYTWFVDGQQIAQEGPSINYTFNKIGEHTIKIVVSDGVNTDSLQINVNVLKPQEPEKKLILHFGVEGIYVSLLDDNMNPVKTLVSDESGTVDFGEIDSDHVNIAITVSPDVVLPKEIVFQRFLGNLYTKCTDNYNDCSITYNEATEWSYLGKIPVSVIEKVLNIEDAKDFDKDNDNFLSIDEVYSLVLNKRDTNNDGKIEEREVAKRSYVNTVIIKDVPVKELNVAEISEMLGYEFGYSFGYNWGYGIKKVHITITNVPEDVESIYGDFFSCPVNNGTAECSVLVPLLQDGSYTVILRNYAYNKYYVAKDVKTDNLEISFDNFKPMKKITVVNFDENATNESLSFKVRYKGGVFFLGSVWHYGYDQVEDEVIDANFGTNYLLNYRLENFHSEKDTSKTYEKLLDDFNYGNSIPDKIDLSEIRAKTLNVNIDINDSLNKVLLSGDELSAVDEIDIIKEFFSENGTCHFELDMPYNNETSILIPDFSKIIPSQVYDNYVKEIVENGSMGIEATAMDIENFNWDSDTEEEGMERSAKVSISKYSSTVSVVPPTDSQSSENEEP